MNEQIFDANKPVEVSKVERRKKILLSAAINFIGVIFLVIGIIKYYNGTITNDYIILMYVVGAITLALTIIFCKKALGLMMALNFGIGGFMYATIILLLVYVM